MSNSPKKPVETKVKKKRFVEQDGLASIMKLPS
jgi:hypothetical protein